MLPVPLWAVALGVAAVAPWLVRAFAGAIEARARGRTSLVIASARRARTPAETGQSSDSLG